MSDSTNDTSGTSSSKKLTEAQWAEAKALYETGKSTKIDISRKYGISRQAVTEGLNNRGAVYGSKSKEIENATIEAQKGSAVRLFEEIAQMKASQTKSNELLQKLQNKAVGDALRESKPLNSQIHEFKALNILIRNQKMMREEMWAIYDLNRDPDGSDEIPEFIVSEYTPDEIELINAERLGISPDDTLALMESEASGEDLLAGILDDEGPT